MTKSIKPTAAVKPNKPYPDFPLFAHAAGQWAKKINGRMYYFGTWDDWEEALRTYHRNEPYLRQGIRPPEPTEPTRDDDEVPTLAEVCNRFLQVKRDLMDAGELAASSWSDYQTTAERLIDQFGRDRLVEELKPLDFERFRKTMTETMGPVTLKNEINRIRILFKYAYEAELLSKPMRFGHFKQPSRKVLQQARNEAGENLFERRELRKLLKEADPFLKAMILLGINGGLGNKDCADLPQKAVDFKSGWLNYPRPKTAIKRRIPLWPETLEAVRKAIELRPRPKDSKDKGLVFVTVQGNRWVRVTPSRTKPQKFVTVNTVAGRFGRLLRKLKINSRKRIGFYTLRHCFETIGGETKDQVAVDSIMGHADPSMAANYRQRIGDDRLKAITDHVHDWLFGGKPDG